MPTSDGLLGKITRAFWLQVGLITLAAILGVYLAKIVIEENLLRNAIIDEQEFFWQQYAENPAFRLPNTKNLTGYFDPDELPAAIRATLPDAPGFYDYSEMENPLVLHISRQDDKTLYLIYYRGQVDALVLYYGIFPLLTVLTILYLTLWLAYRFAHRSISPVVRLAHRINQVDFKQESLALDLPDSGFENNDEIQILSDAITQLGERLNSFVARERNFTRDASHEFRTPLTVINVAADMMLIENNLPPKAQKSLLRIKRAVYDLESLTDVFLMLAREHGGSLTQHQVDVNRIVREQIERAELFRDNKDIRIQLNETRQMSVQSSETVVAVLLGNLIRNAMLYTEQGEIRIDIEDDALVISDSGPGIPASKIDDIFEPFQRATNENASGYGIGLTIVKRLCDQFNWRIDVSSKTDHGTTFKLSFGLPG